MFADDTKLFYTNKNIKVVFETVSKELHCTNKWLKLGKTKYLFFHKQSARDSIPLRLPTTTFNSIEFSYSIFLSNNRPSTHSFTLQGHKFFRKGQLQGRLKQFSLEQDQGHNTRKQVNKIT